MIEKSYIIKKLQIVEMFLWWVNDSIMINHVNFLTLLTMI